jgi:uncharacterized protein (TIGR02466 family)
MIPFEIFPIFPVAVYRSNLRPLTASELAILKNQPTYEQELGNNTSNVPYLLSEAGLEDLGNEIQKHIDNYVKEIMRVSYEIYITNSWINVTQPGEQHMIHTHANSILSGVFYISVNDSNPSISFNRMNAPYLLHTMADDYNLFNSMEWNVPVEDNNIIIFPSTTYHYNKRNKSNNTRISIAFNTFARGNIRTQTVGADLILK